LFLIMATVGSMYEEKLSPNKPPPKIVVSKCEEKLSPKGQGKTEVTAKDSGIFENEKSQDDGEEIMQGQSDAVLDEIAAKVSAMDFNEVEVGEGNHEKCMDTVRHQGETINTLINQLRIMFEEYTSMNNEREYYEELNEALFRCLELNEGTALVDSDAEDDGRGVVGTTISTQTEEDPEKCESAAATMETTEADHQEPTTSTTEKESCTDGQTAERSSEPTTRRKTKMTKRELQNINEVLLREIFELRHQMEVLKESIRDYMNSEEWSQESEYDTDTEDDEDRHECGQCKRPKPNSVARNMEESSQSEDYQYLENDKAEIVDESDSD